MYSALFTNNNALMRYLAVPSCVVFVHLNLCRSIGDTPIFTGKEIIIVILIWKFSQRYKL